jgi:hypothetical protein
MTGPQQPGDWHLHEHGDPARQQAERDPGDPGQSWALPAGDQRIAGRRPMTSRGRSWLLFVTAVSLVLIYVVIWTLHATTHMQDRYVQLPPGQTSATSVTKAQYRVNSLVKTERINDPSQPDDPQIAAAGTIYVVAEIEVLRVEDYENFYCGADLAVDGVRKISLSGGVYLDDTKLPTSCSKDDVAVGQPYKYQAIYSVPTAFADKIYGVAVTYADYGAPYQVIRPPA